MREYSYKDVQEITEAGILFKDGFKLFFEECRNGWAMVNKIQREESYCVAERDILAKPSYYLFFSQDRVKIVFDNKGIREKKKNKNRFQNLQKILNSFGLSSYDMS